MNAASVPMLSKRDGARAQILLTVNRFKLGFYRRNSRRAGRPLPEPMLFGRRHIQEAVCVARRSRLVEPELLVAAGFRAVERRR